MSQRNKLKETLREYYDEQPFPLGPNEWEHASLQLSAARNKRKLRFLLVLIPALFVTVFIVSLHSYKPTESLPKLTQLTKQRSETIPTKKPVLQHTIQQASPEPKPHGTSTHINKSLLSSLAPDTFEEPQPVISPLNVTSSQEPTPIHQAMPELPIIDVERSIPKDQENFGTSATPQEHSETNQPVPESTKQHDKNPPYNGEGLKTEEDSPVHTFAFVPGILSQQEITSHSTTEKGEEATITSASVVIQPTQQITPTTATKPDSLGLDTMTTSEPPQQLANEGIFYEVGGAWFYGWKMDGKQEARGFSPVIGISYLNKISSRFDLSFGVQYLQVPNLSLSGKTSRVSSYTYGEQSKVTIITPSTLHYLVVPLRIRYNINDKQSFGMGVNLAYLLNVDARVTTYDEQPGSTENYKTEKLSGYMRGFSWYDSQLAAFYRRKIISALDIHAEVFFGLTDVKRNEFFGTSGFQRNSGVKITLIYYAFRKM